MTIKSSIFAALALALATVSCKKELEPQESSVTASQAVAPVSPALPASSATPLAATAAPQQIQAQPQQMQVQAQQTQATAPGMNPPHGQPGHRCDIAVGTPLSQPVKTTSVQSATSANGAPITVTPGVISSDGKVTPGSGVKVTTTNAPALLQDPNNKPAETK